MAVKVLMVCLGNICRSPIAEGILKSMTNPNDVIVDSAGTSSYHLGNSPDPRSIAIAHRHGIDISNQRCRQFTTKDFSKFDFIYVMDNSNYKNVVAKIKNDKDRFKTKLILDEVDLDLKEVPDPYYDEEDGFETVFQLLYKACQSISLKLNTK